VSAPARRPVPRGVVGMVHLPPLPGAHRWAGDLAGVIARAVADARALAEGGVDAILVENYGDAPFHADRVEPVTVAAMTRAVAEVRAVVECPVGVNVLRNDARAALAVAAATGARFIRVNVHVGGMYTDQGWVEGRAAETLRLRRSIAPEVAILADVMVKHASPPAGLHLVEAARDTWERGHADALIITGTATGARTDPARVDAVRSAVPDAPLIIGSGVSPATVADALARADAVIVGSALEADGVAGRPVDGERVRRLMDAVGSR
jgi:membrane complex biogenesis BtpA family protein